MIKFVQPMNDVGNIVFVNNKYIHVIRFMRIIEKRNGIISYECNWKTKILTFLWRLGIIEVVGCE